MSKKIKVAIIGVGNCASSLVQGVYYYQNAKATQFVPGLMHVKLGNYHVNSVEFVAGFDVNVKKVGKDISEAIYAEPNNTKVFMKVPHIRAKVYKTPVMDGIGKYLKDIIKISNEKDVDPVSVLKKTGANVLVNYLPVGSEVSAKYWADVALKANCAFINCIPVFIASKPEWSKKFKDKKLPIIGDDIKSQVGATIVHRTLVNLFLDRGMPILRTYQLNTGGNTDFLNMLERERLISKKISKTNAVRSQIEAHDQTIKDEDIHVGPSDYVPWQKDNKICFIRIESNQFGDVPTNLELRLSVEDSPNSAGIVIDAIRCAQIAMDRGIGGSLEAASAYLMKSPAKQIEDRKARQLLEKFIKNK